jgi:raffinose/stachyose/melibiose transport system permease protein
MNPRLNSAFVPGRSPIYIFLFLAPATALFGWIVVKPVIQMLFYSFVRWNGIPTIEMQFVGFANYVELFSDDYFWRTLGNTLLWVAIICVVTVSLGFVIAYLMSQPIQGRTVFQVLYFLPVVQAYIVTAVIWRWMYQPTGALNQFLSLFVAGEVEIGWLGNEYLALPALALARSWRELGLSIVIYVTGLQAVNPNLYESASMDGASFRQKFFYITMPSMRATTTTVLVLMLTSAFKSFDIIWATTQGGPYGTTEILATYIYKFGLNQTRMGFGSAAAVVLTAMVVFFSATYVARRQRWEQ